MIYLRGILIYASILGLAAGLFIWTFHVLKAHDVKVEQSVSSTKSTSFVYGPKESEKIIIDPRRHTITTVTPSAHPATPDVVRKTFFSSVGSTSVDVSSKGDVTVTTRRYGTELEPFGGVAFDTKVRVVIGCDFFYYTRFNAGAFLSGNPNLQLGGGASLSYNAWRNINLFVGYDFVNGHPTGGVTLRW